LAGKGQPIWKVLSRGLLVESKKRFGKIVKWEKKK